MEFTEISEQEFTEFRNTYKDRNFWQSVEMNHFRANRHPKWDYVYVGLKDKGTVRACCSLQSLPVFGEGRLFMALRGFMIDYSDLELVDTFLKGLKVYLHAHHCLYMKTDPYTEYQKHEKDGTPVGKKNDALIEVFTRNGFVHQGFTTDMTTEREPRWMSVLNMEGQTEESLLAAMETSTHRNINHTKKMGVRVRELGDDELDKLKAMVELSGSRKDFQSPDLEYYRHFRQAFGDHMKVLYAYMDLDDYEARYQKEYDDACAKLEELSGLEETRKNLSRRRQNEQKRDSAEKRLQDVKPLKEKFDQEAPLAAAMFLINSHEVIYLFSGSDNSLKHFKGPYLIQWDMIEYTLKHGIDRYNFYGIAGDFNPDTPDWGVYEFKRGFNADVIELIGDFVYVDRKKEYKLYNTLRHIKHSIVH